MDSSFRCECDFSFDNVDVVSYLNSEFVDGSDGLIFDLTTCNLNVMIPVVNLDLVINFELDFEFVSHLCESN